MPHMRYRHIGIDAARSRRVSVLALGAMPFGTRVDEKTATAILDRYVEAGGTFIDTANNYAFWITGSQGGESEALLGRWRRSSGVGDDLVIATKVGGRPRKPGRTFSKNIEGLSPAVIREAADRSRERLGVDRIDLYYAHVPDMAVALEEQVAAFGCLVADGAVGLLGVSNHWSWQVERARALAKAAGIPGYEVLQYHHTYLRQRTDKPTLRSPDGQVGVADGGLLSYLRQEPRLSLVAYSPLLSGGYVSDDRPLGPELDHQGTVTRLTALCRRGQPGTDLVPMSPQQVESLRFVPGSLLHQLGVSAYVADRHPGRTEPGDQLDPLQVSVGVAAVPARGPVDREYQAVPLVVPQRVHGEPGSLGGLGNREGHERRCSRRAHAGSSPDAVEDESVLAEVPRSFLPESPSTHGLFCAVSFPRLPWTQGVIERVGVKMAVSDWYSVDQVAALLGLHVKTVRGYVREGRLRAVRIGKQYRIAREDLEAFTGKPLADPEPVRRQRHAEVTSIAQIDAVSRQRMDQISTYLMATAKTPHNGRHLRVEIAYDEERASMKIVIFGDLDRVAELLRLTSALVEPTA